MVLTFLNYLLFPLLRRFQLVRIPWHLGSDDPRDNRSSVAPDSHLDVFSRAWVFQHRDSVHHVKGHVANLQGVSGGSVRTTGHNEVSVAYIEGYQFKTGSLSGCFSSQT